MKDKILALIGDTQLIQLSIRHVSLDNMVPFGTFVINAVQTSGEIKQLKVDLSMVAESHNNREIHDYQDEFYIELDGSVHLGSWMLERQLAMFKFAGEWDQLSDEELEGIRSYPQDKFDRLISDKYLASVTNEAFVDDQSLVHATHFVYSAIQEELQKIFTQLGIRTC